MRKTISNLLKIFAVLFSLTGITLALIYYEIDGYSHSWKRLMYFTMQSNIWLVCVYIIYLIAPKLKYFQSPKKMDVLYVVKYIFTVSITLTGIIFCSVLGPFAGEEFRAWSFSSISTHAVTPALAIIDFFIDDYEFKFKNTQVLLPLIPPFAYFVFAMVLGFFGVDFGRGDPFPYFFLNFKTPAGFFGIVNEPPLPTIGSFYWIMLCLIIVLGMSLLFAKFSHTAVKERKLKKQSDKE